MKIYLQNIVKGLKQFSESLDKQTMLINKPWALIDSELGIQKLIFKKDKELILSKDGKVVIGKWDYFPEAKSLLIDRGNDKILCNEAYIDDSILVLKLDGKKDDFFILANENNIPDLDAYSYLRKLFYTKFGIQNTSLVGDINLQINPNHNDRIGVDSLVTIDDKDAIDGYYFTKDGLQKIVIQDNKIAQIFYLKKYSLGNGDFIVAEKSSLDSFDVGSPVTINNQYIQDAKYLVDNGNLIIYIVENKIAEVLYLNEYELLNGNKIVIEQNDKYEFEKGDRVIIDKNLAPDGVYKLLNSSKIFVKDGFLDKKDITSANKLFLYIMIIIFIIIILIAYFAAKS